MRRCPPSTCIAASIGLMCVVVVDFTHAQSPAFTDPTGSTSTLRADSELNVPSSNGEAEIADLIRGLASDSYATRLRCRDQLSRIGLAAFDQLRDARNHPDSEVSIVARRLTSGLKVQWSTPGDSANVRELLSEYGSRSPTERENRIARLAKLSRGESFLPLLRLARFEPESMLAQTAALAILRQSNDDVVASNDSETIHAKSGDRAGEFDAIQKQLGDRSSLVDDWLRQYGKDLRAGHPQTNAWQEMIRRQRHAASPIALTPGASSGFENANDRLLELVQITAERAIADGQSAAAQAIVNDNIDLIPAQTRELIRSISWALDHSLFESVVAIYLAHDDLVEKSPVLLYASAEAYSRIGQTESAGKLADTALAINPLPELNRQADDANRIGDDAKPKDRADLIHPQIVRVHAEAHVKIANELVQRGLFRWAEKEYELVMDRLPIDHAIAAYARLRSATMFGELEDHAAVVRLLTPLAKRIEQDNEFEERLIAVNFSSAIVRSQLGFHQGLLLIERNKIEEAREELKQAFDANKNIDILIAMYRLDGDQAWRDLVDERLDQQTRIAESEVEMINQSMQQIGPFRPSNHKAAEQLNAYAWLVSNTRGDYEKALRYSLKSIQLTPNQAALMDTCARCYYAVGDLEAAIKMQAEACETMPHSPPLLRQLEMFRNELKSQSNDKSSER